jgi:hypothetical protein
MRLRIGATPLIPWRGVARQFRNAHPCGQDCSPFQYQPSDKSGHVSLIDQIVFRQTGGKTDFDGDGIGRQGSKNVLVGFIVAHCENKIALGIGDEFCREG